MTTKMLMTFHPSTNCVLKQLLSCVEEIGCVGVCPVSLSHRFSFHHNMKDFDRELLRMHVGTP